MNQGITFTRIVAREVADYVAIGIYKADTCFLHDDDKRIYTFISVPHIRLRSALMVMLARITDEDYVVIETDHTDKPLYKCSLRWASPAIGSSALMRV